MTRDPKQPMRGFNRLLGIELTEWGPDFARMQLRLTPDMLNRNGVTHGGVYCSILDSGCGMAGCYVPEGAPPRQCATLTLTTNFLAPASGGVLTVRARRTGGGRKVFFAEAEIRDEAGRLLASATGAFRYISTSQPPADPAAPEDAP